MLLQYSWRWAFQDYQVFFSIDPPTAVCVSVPCVFLCTAAVAVLGGGEASGPLSPPEQLSEECFSAGEAAAAAYAAAGLQAADIDYWGLYDCFPICFIR
jgi:hypothetical protein